MRRLDAAVIIDHLLDIAVVGCHQHLAADCFKRIHHLLQGRINRFNRLNCRRYDAGMPYHVAIGVIADDDIILAAEDSIDQMTGDFGKASFRLQVISPDFGRRHQYPVFAGKTGIHAAIKENVT